jgi:hypothetical protein
MLKFRAALAGAALALGACTTTSGGPPPGMTAAQGEAYCDKLRHAYTVYVGTVSGALGGVATGGEEADLDARVAIAQCQDGNTAAAIPVLQQKLRDAKVAVPSP